MITLTLKEDEKHDMEALYIDKYLIREDNFYDFHANDHLETLKDVLRYLKIPFKVIRKPYTYRK